MALLSCNNNIAVSFFSVLSVCAVFVYVMCFTCLICISNQKAISLCLIIFHNLNIIILPLARPFNFVMCENEENMKIKIIVMLIDMHLSLECYWDIQIKASDSTDSRRALSYPQSHTLFLRGFSILHAKERPPGLGLGMI